MLHRLKTGTIAEPFYAISGSGKKRTITLSDKFQQLCESIQFANLLPEIESRWNLIEDTWTSNSGENFLPVQYDIDTQYLEVEEKTTYRRNLTKAKNALIGYQKGKCFCCFKDTIISGAELSEVDHFLPFALRYRRPSNLNGVWNLVVACETCNRGQNAGKFGAVPQKKYVERLIIRINYLVNSCHPLSNTLVLQMGRNDEIRRNYLLHFHEQASAMIKKEWAPKFEHDCDF